MNGTCPPLSSHASLLRQVEASSDGTSFQLVRYARPAASMSESPSAGLPAPGPAPDRDEAVLGGLVLTLRHAELDRALAHLPGQGVCFAAAPGPSQSGELLGGQHGEHLWALEAA